MADRITQTNTMRTVSLAVPAIDIANTGVSTGSLAYLDSNGYAWAWGQNTSGAIGNNTAILASTPVSVVGGRRFISIGPCGTANLVALDRNSYAWAWGANASGQIGNNTVTTSSSPVSVVGGRQWILISPTGGNIGGATLVGLGLDSLSYAWAWGINSLGGLGDNTTSSRSSPVSVVGGRQFRYIENAANGTIALDSNSYAWCWGANASGSLGDLTVTNASSPVSVVGGRQWRAAVNNSVGCANTLGAVIALDSNSYAWAWGPGATGSLGNNSTASQSSPVSVVGGRQWLKLCPGGILLDANSYAWCFGANGSGQLGDNSATTRSSPVSVVGGIQWINLKGSTSITIGLDISSRVWAWGQGTNSILTDTRNVNASSPVSIRTATPLLGVLGKLRP